MSAHARPLSDLVTIDQLLSAYFTWLKGEVSAGNRAAKTIDYYHSQLDPWRAALADDLPIEKIRAFHLTGAGGVKRPRKQAVKRLFKWANDEDLVDGSPFSRIKLPPIGQRKRTLSNFELAVLYRAASRPLRWLLLFARHTIVRPGEVRAFRWQQYDAAKSVIVAEVFKGDRRRTDQSELRVVPIKAMLARILDLWRIRRSPRPDDAILRNTKDEVWTCNAVVQAVDTARRRAWIVSVKDGDAERLLGVVARNEAAAMERARLAGYAPTSARCLYDGREPVVCYHLRHTSATRAIENGANLVHLSKAMGHATTRMTQRYLHLDPHELGHVVDLAAPKKPPVDLAAGKKKEKPPASDGG